MHFLPPFIESYVEQLLPEEGELLKKLHKTTYQKVLQPRMLSGHYQGRLLSFLAKMQQPKHILEIGTYTGYATLCMAEGLAQAGIIDTIEINEELEGLIKAFFEASKFSKNIKLHIGDALTIIPQLENTYDMVFIDADKPNYLNYLEVVIDKVNPGGLIIADNTLWSGKVAESPLPEDESTQTIAAYNKLVMRDDRLDSILLPVRDGLMLSRKR
ncbi:MAG: O-methyltransferase [Flavobacteriaceae bacterium]|nr:O-methyltransferase [Flavobacteriaceae bacterium]